MKYSDIKNFINKCLIYLANEKYVGDLNVNYAIFTIVLIVTAVLAVILALIF